MILIKKSFFSKEQEKRKDKAGMKYNFHLRKREKEEDEKRNTQKKSILIFLILFHSAKSCNDLCMHTAKTMSHKSNPWGKEFFTRDSLVISADLNRFIIVCWFKFTFFSFAICLKSTYTTSDENWELTERNVRQRRLRKSIKSREMRGFSVQSIDEHEHEIWWGEKAPKKK